MRRCFAFMVTIFCCVSVSAAHAGYQVPVPSKPPPTPLCSSGFDISGSMRLGKRDRERIKLARAYVHHLDKKGQDNRVIKSIYQASLQVGVDFELMLLKAIMESDLGRFNVAARSSARGLYQYIEPTWLILMKRYGAQIGYKHYADEIRLTKYGGIPYIRGKNNFLKAEILALRHNPDASALIKAYQIVEETEVIRSLKLGKKVTATDHYIAHMLGLKQAGVLYDLKNKGSILAVAKLNDMQMREAAMLNRQFFYEGGKKHGKPLTAREVYKQFEKRVDRQFRNIRQVAKLQAVPTCTASVD